MGNETKEKGKGQFFGTAIDGLKKTPTSTKVLIGGAVVGTGTAAFFIGRATKKPKAPKSN